MQGKDEERNERFLSFQMKEFDGNGQKRRGQQKDEREVLRQNI